ncbi:MAG: squalene synthase HpnC [Comamonadaceae bacterium]|nr:MAG: squalene synthase HpnC [Comamonadaceae bacterium]
MRTPPSLSSDNRPVNPTEPPAPHRTTAQTAPATAPASGPALAPPVTHYENFPVASLLCPPHLRQPIAAIYAFARAADDLADEGDASPDERLADLAAYRAQLHAMAAGERPLPRWAAIFTPLQAVQKSHDLPVALLDDLLDAFMQDVAKTRDQTVYADRTELLDYCRRSANPVGRLLLHLYGVHGDAALAQSDAICSALQLINFWQDLSVDLPRGRHYLTDADCAAHGVDRAQLATLRRTPQTDALVMDCAHWARVLMLQGAPLVHRLPGRAGWELRLVVQGGLRILDKVEALNGASLHTRPTLGPLDRARMLGRSLRM